MAQPYKFNVGDKCRVRQWDDMKRQFGGCESHISTPRALFVAQMKCLCGKMFTVSRIYDGGFGYQSCEGIEFRSDICEAGWMITGDMLEPADDSDDIIDFEPGDIDALWEELYESRI